MKERRGYRIDRRSGDDRRKVHNLNYFIRGGVERRKYKERRSHVERRKTWLRVDEWVSVFVGHTVSPNPRRILSLHKVEDYNSLSPGTERRSVKRDCHGD